MNGSILLEPLPQNALPFTRVLVMEIDETPVVSHTLAPPFEDPEYGWQVLIGTPTESRYIHIVSLLELPDTLFDRPGWLP